MKILANASVKKLKENRRGYGAEETIQIPFIKESESEIELLDSLGQHVRTMRKGTKLLVSFEGTEITERAFNLRKNKAVTLYNEEKSKRLKKEFDEQIEKEKQVEIQLELWVNFLKENPIKVEKYLEKIKDMNAPKWRNYLKMKFAFACNDQSFQGIHITPPILRDAILNLIELNKC